MRSEFCRLHTFNYKYVYLRVDISMVIGMSKAMLVMLQDMIEEDKAV